MGHRLGSDSRPIPWPPPEPTGLCLVRARGGFHESGAVTGSESTLQLKSVDAEATTRLRWAAAVSVLVEVILPAVEATLFPQPDWLAIEIQSIWFGLTVAI